MSVSGVMHVVSGADPDKKHRTWTFAESSSEHFPVISQDLIRTPWNRMACVIGSYFGVIRYAIGELTELSKIDL
jgi:hypothetical protein